MYSMHPNFDRDKFLMHQKHLAVARKYHIYDEAMRPLLYVEREKLKLRPSIHIYESDAKKQMIVSIRPRSIIALNPKYDVLDASTHQMIGSLRRLGWRSLFRRRWEILDNTGQLIGQAYEDSALRAFMRRLIPFGAFLKTDFHIEVRGRRVGIFIRKLSIRDKYVLDLTGDQPRSLDRRQAVALGVLLDSAERR